jgi:hypothetical protein
MPLQNRVLPTGEIVADPARGMLMGNRGCLHDDNRQVRAPWRLRAWITCVLAFRGRVRQPMRPGHYTELFFLDEAVALAAGHRPCAECRRAEYDAWRAAWRGAGLPGDKAGEMDAVLHAARVGADRRQRRFMCEIRNLPDGVFILHEGRPGLIRQGRLHPYLTTGYEAPLEVPQGMVEVMTPAPTVAVLRAGYRPVLHPGAGSGPFA